MTKATSELSAKHVAQNHCGVINSREDTEASITPNNSGRPRTPFDNYLIRPR